MAQTDDFKYGTQLINFHWTTTPYDYFRVSFDSGVPFTYPSIGYFESAFHLWQQIIYTPDLAFLNVCLETVRGILIMLYNIFVKGNYHCYMAKLGR